MTIIIDSSGSSSSNGVLLDNKSVQGTVSELALFSVPPTTIGIEQSFWEEVRPVNAVTERGPYEFSIAGNNHYIDLSNNFMYLKIKIVKADGTAIKHTDAAAPKSADDPPTSFVAPINMIGATFFRQVKMIVNGRLTYDSGTDYPYLAYILTDLNYGKDARETHLRVAGLHRDCPRDGSSPEAYKGGELLDTFRNPGSALRKNIHRDSRSVEYMAALHIPFAHQDRYLLSHLDIRLELHRSSNAFALHTGTNSTPTSEQYKIEVEDMKFYVRKVALKRDLYMSIEKELQTMPAKYPVRRMEMKTLHIGMGRSTTPVNTIWNGQLPRRVIMCTIPNANYFGSYGTNPFLFHPYNVTKACLYVNSQCIPYSGPLEMKFFNTEAEGTSLITRAFTQLYASMGVGLSNNTSMDIDPHRFIRDACYFVFDLSIDCAGDLTNWELLRTGTLNVYMEFSEPIKESGLRLLVLGEFDNLITVDKLRQIQYDYAI